MHSERTRGVAWPSFVETLSRRPVFGVLIAFVVVFSVFAIVAPQFLSLGSLTGIMSLVAELGIITIGEALLIISGEFDLSVSGVYALAGAIFVSLAAAVGSVAALAAALLIAAGIGAINWFVTRRMGIPSFIATLGMMLMTRGVLLAATGGRSLQYTGDELVPTLLVRVFANGLRPSHVWFILLVVILSFVLFRTPYGNWVFATGGDMETARARGIPTDRVKLINFITTSVLAAFAGCIAISRFRFANVAFGVNYELEAIAAAVIGGTFMFGGYGSILGAALGAFIVGMVRSGLVMAGVPGYYYRFFVGAILIVAAYINNRIRLRWS